MAGITKSQVETILKRNVVDAIRDFVPNSAKIVKMLSSKELEKDGREFTEPVCLSHEHGVTYGDDTDFQYNDSINGIYDEIKLQSNPMVLQSRINLKAFNRLNSEQSVGKRLAHRFMNIKKSMSKRLELSYLYGGVGLGKSTGGTGGQASVNATTIEVTISTTTFAKGIWGGMKNAQFDVYDGSTLLNTNGAMTFSKVDPTTRKLTFTGVADDVTAIDNSTAAVDIYFRGAKDKEMLGIDSQITTNSGTLFNISKDDYELWRGASYACGGSFSMTKILEGLSDPLNIGGLDEDITVWVPHDAFTDLNIDEAALREYDSSYDSKKSKRGSKELCFVFQGGELKVRPHMYLKRGEAFAIPDRCIKKVGATEMDFIVDADKEGSGDNKSILRKLESNAAYQILFGVDQHILITDPVLCIKYTGLVA